MARACQPASPLCMQLNQLVGIYNILIGKNLDKVDQCQNAANVEAEGHHDLEDTLLGLTQHKVVDAQATQEEAHQRNRHLILTVQILAGRSVFNGNTAIQANISTGIYSSAAVSAVSIAITGLYTTLQANSLIVIHCSAAISTEHTYYLFLFFCTMC